MTASPGDGAAGSAKPFDYGLPAEMFISSPRGMRRSPITYRRFATAAEAIRFAVEELPLAQFAGAIIEVAEERFDHEAIRNLYDRAD